MIRKFFTSCLAVLPFSALTQVALNPQIPPAGLLQKEQLWNVVIVNNGDLFDGNLQLDLQDASTGQVVLTATSINFSVARGVKLIKPSDIQPVSYVYNEPDFAKSFLPMGNYMACYRMINISGSKDAVVAQECGRINIDPLSPPVLNTPADKSVVETPYPQFTWMPPMPIDMFTSLNYDILVTEVLPGQSATEAIQYNNPIYTGSNVLQPYESYPTSLAALDTGKLYAWQVLAKNGTNYSAKTEVWTFKVAPPSWIKLIIEQTPFTKMKTAAPEKGIAPNSFLKIAYNNETTDTSVVVHIVDLKDKQKPEGSFAQKIIRGENLIQEDLRKLLHAADGTSYEAYIINSRGEKWRMLFEVKEYNTKRTERN